MERGASKWRANMRRFVVTLRLARHIAVIVHQKVIQWKDALLWDLIVPMAICKIFILTLPPERSIFDLRTTQWRSEIPPDNP